MVLDANLFSQLPRFILLMGLVFVLAAGLQDLFTRRIANVLCAGMALLGLSYTILTDAGTLLQHFGSAILVFLPSLLLYRRAFFGGGDVKMITALALWLMPGQLALFVIWTLMCGGVAGLLVLGYTMVRRMLDSSRHMVSGVPYGVGIAGGFLVAVGQVVR